MNKRAKKANWSFNIQTFWRHSNNKCVSIYLVTLSTRKKRKEEENYCKFIWKKIQSGIDGTRTHSLNSNGYIFTNVPFAVR